jgi:hypothetical protein
MTRANTTSLSNPITRDSMVILLTTPLDRSSFDFTGGLCCSCCCKLCILWLFTNVSHLNKDHSGFGFAMIVSVATDSYKQVAMIVIARFCVIVSMQLKQSP